MSAAATAHQKIVDLLDSYEPSTVWVAVHPTHTTADLLLPSLSVEIETETPIVSDGALVSQELVDNWDIRLSVRVHTGYRLGIIDTAESADIVDIVIRWLRENIALGDGFRIFEVTGTAFNVEHTSSGTTGAEILITIHKVEYYDQT